MTKQSLSISILLAVIAAVVIGLDATRMNSVRVAPIEPAAVEASSSESRADELRSNAADATDPGEKQGFVASRELVSASPSTTSGASTTIRGRVVDVSGAPADLKEASCWLGWRSRRPILEDGGRFHLVVPDGEMMLPPRTALPVRELVFLLPASPEKLQRRGAVDLPVELPVELDVGDIVLEDPPSLVAGWIVDDQDQPAPSVFVQVQQKDQLGVQQQSGPNWMTAYSDGLGRFEIRAWTSSERFDLLTKDSRYEDNLVRDVGARRSDVKIVLQRIRWGGVMGRVLVDDPGMLSKLSVEIASPDSAGAQRLSAQSGAFMLHAREGEFALEVRLDFGNLILDTIDHIAVAENTISKDPRLDPLDLRGKLEWIETTLRAANGTPYRWSVQIEAKGVPPGPLRPDSNGVLRLLAVVGGPRWILRPPGGEPIELTPGRTIAIPGS
jgi:hypothetical protein